MNEPENKTTATETEEPKAKAEKPKKKVDPFKQMVPIYLDKSMGGDANYVYAGVNGHVYQVPTGMDIEVPKPIYQVLMDMRANIRVLDGVRAQIAKDNRENMKLM